MPKSLQIKRLIHGFRRRATGMALGLAIIFSALALFQYWFVRREVFKTITLELNIDAEEVAKEIFRNGKWSLKGYRQASIPVHNWNVISSEGLIVDIEGFTPGLFGAVGPVDRTFFGDPKTVVTDLGEKWRLLGMDVQGGSVILGTLDPESLAAADAKLKLNAKKFGSTLDDAIGVKSHDVDIDVDYSVISSSGELKLGEGGVPLKTDLRYLLALSQLRQPVSLEGKAYLIFSKPILNSSNIGAGTILIPKDVSTAERTLREQRLFNLGLAGASFVIAILLAIYFVGREIVVRPKHYSVREALNREIEDQNIEFKPTFQSESPSGRDFTFEALKTVAGFLNAEGGTLFIGVANDATVCGIEADLTRFDKSRDRFANHVVKLITGKIGPQFFPFIQSNFEEVDGGTVYLLHVNPSHTPAFVRWGDETHFFVREGGRTQPLNAQQQHEYIRIRWRR